MFLHCSRVLQGQILLSEQCIQELLSDAKTNVGSLGLRAIRKKVLNGTTQYAALYKQQINPIYWISNFVIRYHKSGASFLQYS